MDTVKKTILYDDDESILDFKFTKNGSATKLHKIACWVAWKIINDDNLSL